MKYFLGLSAFTLANVLVSGQALAAEGSGIDLGLRLGYGIPLGSAAENEKLNDLVSGQVPIWVDAGYRFAPNIMAGLYFQYGFAFLPDSSCPSPASCSASDIRFGIQGQYRFMPRESVDPWLGLGIGYEWLDYSVSAGGFDASAGVHGWEFLHLQGGADFKVADGFGIGPFLDFSLGQYSSGSVTTSALPVLGQPVSGSGDIQNKALHEWLTLGVRAVFDP